MEGASRTGNIHDDDMEQSVGTKQVALPCALAKYN